MLTAERSGHSTRRMLRRPITKRALLPRQQQRTERLAQRRILVAIQTLRDSIQVAPLARLIAEGRWIELLRTAVPLDTLFAPRLRTELARLFQATYHAGGDQAAEQVQSKLVRKDVTFRTRVLNWGFDVLNPRGLEFLQQHGAERVTQITDETRTCIRTLLSSMYNQGVPPLEQAKRIKEYVGLTEQHAQAVENLRERLVDEGVGSQRVDTLVARKVRQLTELRALNISRTELQFALSSGRSESYRQAADEGLIDRQTVTRIWSTAEDEQTCPICEPMDGQVSPGLDGTFTTGDGDEVDDPPVHVNCLLGDSYITAADGIAAVSKRWYDGDFIVIRTASGNQLACTPNHPILTDAGWLPARCLNVGRHVISSRIRERRTFRQLNHQDVPATIHEIAEAARNDRQMVARPMPVTAEDFHGDGMGSEVAVVWTDGELMDNGDAAFNEQARHLALQVAYMGLIAFSSLRSRQQFGIRRRASLSGFMGRANLRLPRCWRHGRPLQSLRFAPTANYNAGFLQAVVQDATADTELVGKLLQGFAGPVFADEVVNVDVRTARCHVYNLQTKDSYYIAGGMVTHNCRCSVDLGV